MCSWNPFPRSFTLLGTKTCKGDINWSIRYTNRPTTFSMVSLFHAVGIGSVKNFFGIFVARNGTSGPSKGKYIANDCYIQYA